MNTKKERAKAVILSLVLLTFSILSEFQTTIVFIEMDIF